MMIMRIVGVEFGSIDCVVRLVLVDGCLGSTGKLRRRNVSFRVDCIRGRVGVVSLVFIGE